MSQYFRKYHLYDITDIVFHRLLQFQDHLPHKIRNSPDIHKLKSNFLYLPISQHILTRSSPLSKFIYC